ncbi:MAG: ParB/RepB/Spo0J family partition protein [Faecousia sp.]
MSFDLGAMLKNVSNLDTIREQIEYIRLDRIESDSNNFYKIEGIEDLAANISLCGLQQPIRVRQKPEDPDRFVTVSGHRRRAALELLAKDDPERWGDVPCIVERDSVSPALQQLRLIYANANTRTMTSSELGEQAAQVEKLLYQLKEEGYEFPGRMRDHVAEAVNTSKTKLARLRVIRENLAECWRSSYKDDIICESTAYELSHMPEEWQRIVYEERRAMKSNFRFLYAEDIKAAAGRMAQIDKLNCGLNCSKSGSCLNKEAKLRQSVHTERYFDTPCVKCCDVCDKLTTCKNACSMLAEKIKQIKAHKKEERQQEKVETEKKEKPVIDYIQGVYDRVGKSRKTCGATVEDLYRAQKVFYAKSDDQKESDMESGAAKISVNTTLPFGYNFRYEDAMRLCAVADLLGCSTDYLLGRDVSNSDTAPAQENVSNSDTWRTGAPKDPGDYVVMVCYCDDCGASSADMHWDGEKWLEFGEPLLEDAKVLTWIHRPHELLVDYPLNESCKTGLSPSGHCGAAAYCEKPYECCCECPDECNSRCGWIDEDG